MPSQQLEFPAASFSSTFPQQSLRLLELPPELVTLIEDRSKVQGGGRRLLWLKSAPPAAAAAAVNGNRNGRGFTHAAAATTTQQGSLHLCTAEKVWAVKQVSTSNSVYVARTHNEKEIGRGGDANTNVLHREQEMAEAMAEPEADTGSEGMEDGRTSIESATMQERKGITTISIVKNILELHEVKTDVVDVEEQIRPMIPSFNSSEEEEGEDDLLRYTPTRGSDGRQEAVTLKDIFDAVPAPTRLITDAVKRLFVFEIPGPLKESVTEGRRVFVPSTSLLLRAWRSFMQQCAISGVRIDADGGLAGSSLQTVLEGLKDDADNEAEGMTLVNVTSAILRRFASNCNHATTQGEDTGADDDVQVQLALDPNNLTNQEEHLTFTPSEPRALIGTWLLASLSRSHSLQADTGSNPLTLSDLTAQWTSLLPDSWAQDCDPRALISSFSSSVAGTGTGINVTIDDKDDVVRFTTATSGTASAKDAGAGPKTAQQQKKRKWHEIFGAQRSSATT